jgi:hypothetical protein
MYKKKKKTCGVRYNGLLSLYSEDKSNAKEALERGC